MKTWEMIKELTEHTEKKFKSRDLHGRKVICFIEESEDKILAYKKIGEKGWEDLTLEFGFENTGRLNWEWEEVIEPVDFITAYNDCLENGTEYICEDYYFHFKIYKNEYGNVIINPNANIYRSSDTIIEVNLYGAWRKVG